MAERTFANCISRTIETDPPCSPRQRTWKLRKGKKISKENAEH